MLRILLAAAPELAKEYAALLHLLNEFIHDQLIISPDRKLLTIF
jgi:hypothetical protein